MLGKGHGSLFKPRKRKREKSEKLRGERDQIKSIDLRFESGPLVEFAKGIRKQYIS